jgi:hypothetical protein
MTSSSQSKTCPPATWTVAEGVKWLQKEGFTDQVAKFEAERVDGTALLSLTTDELKDELDVKAPYPLTFATYSCPHATPSDASESFPGAPGPKQPTGRSDEDKQVGTPCGGGGRHGLAGLQPC